MKSLYATFMILMLAGLRACPAQQVPGPSIADFTEPPDLRWTFSTRGAVYAPAVENQGTLYVGSCDSLLYAIELTNGHKQWTYAAGGDIRSAAVISNDSVFLVSGNGQLHCISRQNGNLFWKFTASGDHKYSPYAFADYFLSTPLLLGDKVIFGSGDGRVYAVNRKDGKQRWAFQTGDVVHASPVTANGLIYIGSFDGYFYALHQTDGALAWKFKSIGQRWFPKGEMQGTALVANEMVYVAGRDYNLYARKAKDGLPGWNRQFSAGWAMTTPVLKDAVVYVGTSDDRALFALDPNDGRVHWKADLRFNIFAAPAFSDAILYVPTLMGRLYALSRKDGTVLWKTDSRGYAANHLRYFNEDDAYRSDIQQIVTGDDGFLRMYYALGAIFSTPLLVNNRMIVTSTDGNIYCYERR
ncbi:outer membrane protein assembly factor BamB family protein [Flavihumibacter petaseus]|uniref:Pyrrolo-quinoline quinone repeat domain-containing protein n=1 Tax=Flavihumibacter petaseus NBRC 106054 TaxID=1220578 RepID=A0A0E9MVZ1_9BACT|nr:PQQ-binding-like beta-propeller repeat protein [Flavihumibacter petaseus]GAO41887.1 hypothetical protein FPE01S_01_09020 [Flavihumibacter petaseus NBRC 106054]